MASFVGIYARALADVVIDRKLDASRVTEELDLVSSILKESAALRTIWDSPSVPPVRKLKLLDGIAARVELSREVRNFVAVIVSNRRIHDFRRIAQHAAEEINDRLGLVDAEILSARELSAEEKRKLESQVTSVTGKTVRVRYSLDTKLMGGAVIKVGSTIYDGSVRGQLQRMKEQLAAG